jgi:C1A family cysteine protease
LSGRPETEYQQIFIKWIKEHKKTYTHDSFFPRYNVFKTNVDRVDAHNALNKSYTLGLNVFADLTKDEFKAKYVGSFKHRRSHLRPFPPHIPTKGDFSGPESVNWVEAGAVTPVKDQALCGSCYAHSTTGAVEGAWQIAKGQLLSLSEQQIVDCSQDFGNLGCAGGLMDNSFNYIIANKGIGSEEDYSYTALQGDCKKVKSVATISAFDDVPQFDEKALLAAIAKQPVSVGVDADENVFHLYKSGVINSDCGTHLGHGVLIVGYGSEEGLDYYLVKNSWGPGWGDKGYLKIGRGSDVCGISQAASYPVV